MQVFSTMPASLGSCSQPCGCREECSEGDVKGPSPRRPQLHRDVEVTMGPGEGPSQADRQVWKAQKGRRGLPQREKAE